MQRQRRRNILQLGSDATLGQLPARVVEAIGAGHTPALGQKKPR